MIRSLSETSFAGTLPAGITTLTNLAILYAPAVMNFHRHSWRKCLWRSREFVFDQCTRGQVFDQDRAHRAHPCKHLGTHPAAQPVPPHPSALPRLIRVCQCVRSYSAISQSRLTGTVPSTISALTALSYVYAPRPDLASRSRNALRVIVLGVGMEHITLPTAIRFRPCTCGLRLAGSCSEINSRVERRRCLCASANQCTRRRVRAREPRLTPSLLAMRGPCRTYAPMLAVRVCECFRARCDIAASSPKRGARSRATNG